MRKRLCAAALSMFREGGIDAVTFRGLADAAGASHTLPYRYFENKDALLASVRVMCFEQFEQFVRAREEAVGAREGAVEREGALGREGGVRASGGTTTLNVDRVLAVMDAYVDFVFQHPVEYSLIFVTPQPPPQRYPELLAARRRLFEHSVQLVQRCIDEGAVHGNAREITHAVWGSVHGLLSLHVANQLVHGCRIEELVRPTIFRILGLPAGGSHATP
jgi:AcrR family transcriptional regulator